MTWHYQIRRKRYCKDWWYEIVETHRKPFGMTIHPITPGSESRRGLIQILEMMLHDARKYRTITEKET